MNDAKDGSEHEDVRSEEPQDGASNQPGRPTKFSDEIADVILDLAEKGRTDQQIAELVGISRSTLTLWKTKHMRFSVALKLAKETPDDMVEAALFQRAIGYVRERDIMVGDTSDAEKCQVMTLKEEMPPSEVAAIFWLKSRRPERWRDKQEISHAAAQPFNLAYSMRDVQAVAERDDEDHGV